MQIAARHVDATHNAVLRIVPVVEAHEVGTSHADERAAEHLLRRERRPERALLLEVFHHLDLRRGLARGKLRRVDAPRHVEGRTEALVAPCQGGVRDEFAVAAHEHEAAIWRVLERLRVKVARAELLHGKRQSLAVRDRLVLSRGRERGLDVHRVHLAVPRPDHLAARIHARNWLLASKLDHHRALVVADSHLVASLDVPQRPHTLHSIVERVLEAICGAVPDSHGAVLGS